MTTEAKPSLPHAPHPDVALVSRIDAVPTILDVICEVTGMGFAAVARVTDTQWIACQVRDDVSFGLRPGGELELQSTICDEIRGHHQMVVIDHVAQDERYRSHHTPRRYGLQSYISMPVFRHDGAFFGTLCAVDSRPRKLNTPTILGMFRLFADLIGKHVDAQARLAQSEADLALEREASELREQFIAVLGHDLRNPLGSILAGTTLLRKRISDPAALPIMTRMEQSVGRMSGLIDDVMDFARGRMGSGLSMDLRIEQSVESSLRHVVDELRSGHPGRDIRFEAALGEPFYCDAARIGQLLSNLVANALTHGAADSPVVVRLSNDGEQLALSVANRGTPIPPAVLAKLFEPFFRGADQPSRQGLGLGLYIAHQIALAHGGTLRADSTPDATVFTFTMPCRH